MSDLDKSRVIILLSGGMDSAACCHFFLEKDFNVSGLFIDFGQPASNLESQAAKAISDFYNICLTEIKLTGYKPPIGGYVLARNIFLLSTAIMSSNIDSGLVAIGVHSGTPYQDCSKQFLDLSQSIFDLYANGKIIVTAPFIDQTKGEILDYCKSFNLPMHLTYSCELGLKQPCGKCDTCKDLEALGVS